MTLKELRGKCFEEVNHLNPVEVIPGVVGEIRRCIRKAVRSCGGIFRTAPIVTVDGIQEYGVVASEGIGAGFPVDFKSVYRAYRPDGIRIDLIERKDRHEAISLSVGTPYDYYIDSRARRIGFDPVPNLVLTILMDYYGLGDDVSEDDDVVLPEFSMLTDDPLWDAVVFEFASTFFRRLAVRDKVFVHDRDFYSGEAGKARFALRGEIGSYNKDKMPQGELPDEMRPFAGRIGKLERIGNSGDVFRFL